MSIPDSLVTLSWSEASPQIKDVNPELWEKICTVDGVEKMEFVRARYPYGVDIAAQTKFNLFFAGELRHYKDPKIPKSIAKILDFNWKSLPPGILLKNSLESFLVFKDYTVPRNILRPGMTFSVYPAYDQENSFYPEFFYSLSSGCRSLLMLPSITHHDSSQRLIDRCGVDKSVVKPKKIDDVFPLVQQLTKGQDSNIEWYTELLYFPETLINQAEKTAKLDNYLLKKVWGLTTISRYKFIYDMIWSRFIYDAKRKLSLDSAIIGAATKIILISLGQDPGIVPLNDNSQMPLDFITNIFVETYRIRYNQPIFMGLGSIARDKSVYFSLRSYRATDNYHTLGNVRVYEDFRKVEKLVALFIEYFSQVLEDEPPESMKVVNVLVKTKFEAYFQKAKYNDSNNLQTEDERFQYYMELDKALGFPKNSDFFQGCIRISR